MYTLCLLRGPFHIELLPKRDTVRILKQTAGDRAFRNEERTHIHVRACVLNTFTVTWLDTSFVLRPNI